MCDFCHKHGEGKKWYLEACNYSEDLLSDLKRRKFITDFFAHPEKQGEGVDQLAKLDKAPGFVRRAISRRVSNKMKKIHYGQVVPFEEVERIFGFVTSIVRLACICRQITTGSEQRFCYGISMAPNGGRIVEILRGIDAAYLTGPNTKGFETLNKEDALAALRDHEHEGCCHTVWTFVPPFIGGVCNCDQSDCLAMRATVRHAVPIFFRAEYVAKVSPDPCNGCRQCMRVCPFGAVFYSAANKKAMIDERRCYGCGICHSACTKDAIFLFNRRSVPVSAAIW